MERKRCGGFGWKETGWKGKDTRLKAYGVHTKTGKESYLPSLAPQCEKENKSHKQGITIRSELPISHPLRSFPRHPKPNYPMPHPEQAPPSLCRTEHSSGCKCRVRSHTSHTQHLTMQDLGSAVLLTRQDTRQDVVFLCSWVILETGQGG